MKIRFESTECERCGGTGHHQYNQIDGTICYGCNGSGRALTRNGAQAREAYEALIDERCTKPAENVQVGEKIWQKADRAVFGIPPRFRRSGFYEVIRSEQDTNDPCYWDIDVTPDPETGEPRGTLCAKGVRVRVANPQVQQQIMRQIARTYPGATLISNEAEDVAFAAEEAKRDAVALAKRQAREKREAAKEDARRAEREAKAHAEGEAWRAENPDLVAWFEQRDPETFDTSYHGSMHRHATNVRAGHALTPADTRWVRAWIARDAERTAKAAASTHVGTVGARVTITATLDARINMGKRGYGTRTRYKVVMTEQGTGAKLVSWTDGDWPWDLDEGQTFTCTATIAKHGAFRGERETEIKNVRIKK
jgi:hypothetical protein